ncbi:hypothetical protein EVAR_35587_1 [Eumeta japonica]|uniref:Uncharacterized protein n=1 Tax=Eumeta variegata TaxID=151549 RepID=A0A4C1XL74_EUMVA|nr:hypothetical protein EVAR_35587_1 [Eumeta japonica]
MRDLDNKLRYKGYLFKGSGCEDKDSGSHLFQILLAMQRSNAGAFWNMPDSAPLPQKACDKSFNYIAVPLRHVGCPHAGLSFAPTGPPFRSSMGICAAVPLAPARPSLRKAKQRHLRNVAALVLSSVSLRVIDDTGRCLRREREREIETDRHIDREVVVNNGLHRCQSTAAFGSDRIVITVGSNMFFGIDLIIDCRAYEDWPSISLIATRSKASLHRLYKKDEATYSVLMRSKPRTNGQLKNK